MFHLIVDAFPHWMAYPMWKSITFECRNKYVSPLKHTESAKSTSVHSTEMAAAVVSSRPEKWMDWEGRDALRARLFFEAASTSTMSFLHSHTITLDRPPPVWRDFLRVPPLLCWLFLSTAEIMLRLLILLILPSKIVNLKMLKS